MNEKKGFKYFDISSIDSRRWSFGAFIAYEKYEDIEVYFMISLFKWQISIGRMVDYGA